MQMRQSKVLKKLRAGEVVNCVKLNLSDPRVSEIAAMCGFDCIWCDMEHVPSDWQSVENHIRAAKAYDVDVLVRVAKGSYSDFVQPLEADAAGIMVPHIMTVKEAQEVVHWTRFHPLGKRPVDGGNADGKYTMVDFDDYIKTANKERFVIVQIEDPEPLDVIEEIAQIKGIDMLFFGPGDFSQGIGKPGQWDADEISDTRALVAKICGKYNKFAGTVGGAGSFQELVDMGYNFISLGADVVGLCGYFNDIIEKISNIKKTKIDSIYEGK